MYSTARYCTLLCLFQLNVINRDELNRVVPVPKDDHVEYSYMSDGTGRLKEALKTLYNARDQLLVPAKRSVGSHACFLTARGPLTFTVDYCGLGAERKGSVGQIAWEACMVGDHASASAQCKLCVSHEHQEYYLVRAMMWA